ncbi:MAG: hypothetical protein JNK66_12750 [Chitinophagales bacterium]|nr:hypothetical protein [Chitinophagales bacterium]
MKHYYLLLMLFCMGILHAQNLVPNPSFEEYDTCPDFAGQINRAVGYSYTLVVNGKTIATKKMVKQR